MPEDFNPITLEGLNSSTDVHYFNNKVSFFEPVDVFESAKFSGGLDATDANSQVKDVFEKTVVRDNYENGAINIDLTKGSLVNFTQECSTNFTINIRGAEKTDIAEAITLNDYLPVGRSVVVTVLILMGSSAYVMSNPTTTGFKIDGNDVVVKWINSTAPTSGFTNAVNAYTFAIIKNAAADFTVLGTLSSFG